MQEKESGYESNTGMIRVPVEDTSTIELTQMSYHEPYKMYDPE